MSFAFGNKRAIVERIRRRYPFSGIPGTKTKSPEVERTIGPHGSYINRNGIRVYCFADEKDRDAFMEMYK